MCGRDVRRNQQRKSSGSFPHESFTHNKVFDFTLVQMRPQPQTPISRWSLSVMCVFVPILVWFFVCRRMRLFGQCYYHLIACWLWIYSHVLLCLCSPVPSWINALKPAALNTKQGFALHLQRRCAEQIARGHSPRHTPIASYKKKKKKSLRVPPSSEPNHCGAI